MTVSLASDIEQKKEVADDGDTRFACGACGAQGIYVVHRYEITEHWIKVLPCRCGLTDIAAEFRCSRSREYFEQGDLSEYGEWLPVDTDEMGVIHEYVGDDDIEVFCDECYHDDLRKPHVSRWMSVDKESGVEPQSHSFIVRCLGCHRVVS